MSEQPGLLKKVQGIGWYLDEANIAQVSTNILDYELTPLHSVYEEVCRDAEVRQQSHRSLFKTERLSGARVNFFFLFFLVN